MKFSSGGPTHAFPPAKFCDLRSFKRLLKAVGQPCRASAQRFCDLLGCPRSHWSAIFRADLPLEIGRRGNASRATRNPKEILDGAACFLVVYATRKSCVVSAAEWTLVS